MHAKELTYSVILSRRHITPFKKREVYRFIAHLLLECFQMLGIQARVSVARSGGLHNANCYRTTGEFELVSMQGSKLAGSAQLISRNAVLQHGSIPLDDSYRAISQYLRDDPIDPGLPAHPSSSSLRKELGRDIELAEVVAAFREGLANRIPVENSQDSQH